MTSEIAIASLLLDYINETSHTNNPGPSHMENLDIDGKYISWIRNLYWNQKAYMRTEDGLSPEIHIKRGVRQGCVLSPCLFNLYTENIFGAINTNKA